VSYNADAVTAYAVGAQPTNWNVHSAGASGSCATLQAVLAQIWPSAFEVGASGAPVLDTSLLESATEVGTRPQTVVYQINPHAIWSDGEPITYRDFVYNWQAQSGNRSFSDVGGARFTPSSTAGYDEVADVTGSPADPYRVTVTFARPYPDWRSLFSYLMPAHIAQSIGFDHGFSDPVADLVSGGPFIVAQAQQGYSLELVRNARYWANPANLAAVTYYFTTAPAEVVDALSAGELGLAVVQGPATVYQQLQGTGGLSVRAVATAGYEDLDFNEATSPFGHEFMRQAVMMAVDRGAMAGAVLGPFGLATTAVENRVLLPATPGYSANGTAFDQAQPAAALALLAGYGYLERGATLFSPQGAPVAIKLYVSSDDPWGAGLASQVAAGCAEVGISVTVVQWRGKLPGGWQMAIERRQLPVFPGVIASRYATGGSANVDGYSSPTMDGLLSAVGTTPASDLPGLYDEVDAQAWKDSVDLPLVAVPEMVAFNRHLLNVQPGPYPDELAWNEQDWGFASP